MATGRHNLCEYQLGDGGGTSANAVCYVGTVFVSLSRPPPWGPLRPLSHNSHTQVKQLLAVLLGTHRAGAGLAVPRS